ncbi:MAG: GrpB family protein [Dehalococcoidia bacterium]
MSPDADVGAAEPVQVVDYDPAWPAAYERERGLIADALGDLMLGIEHVGSTAVSGLGAKPVIDIMIAVSDLADGEKCVRPLEGLGYEYKGEFGIPGRLYFRRFTEGRRSRQIHMVEVGSDFWERHLLFRDYLRAHAQDARRYYELKLRLAAQFRDDRVGYTEAKTEFIRSAEAKARAAKTA